MSCSVRQLTLLLWGLALASGLPLKGADQKVWYTHLNAQSRETPLDEIKFSPAYHSFHPPENFSWVIFLGFDRKPISGYQVPLYRMVGGAMKSIPDSYVDKEMPFFPQKLKAINGGMFYGGDFSGANAIRSKLGLNATEPIWVNGHNLRVLRKVNP